MAGLNFYGTSEHPHMMETLLFHLEEGGVVWFAMEAKDKLEDRVGTIRPSMLVAHRGSFHMLPHQK